MRFFCKAFPCRPTPAHSRKSGKLRFGWLTRCLIVICLVGLAGPPALRADIVVLSNGDRLTGQVEQLRDQKLSFKTSYAGTIQINWADVTELTTENNFEVEAETGRRYQGRIVRGEQDLEVVHEDTSAEVPAPTIVAMIPMSNGDLPGFWQRLQGAIDLGYSLTRGNSRLNQSSVGSQASYRRENYEMKGSISSLFSKQDNSEATSRQTLDLQYDRFLSPKAFAFTLSSFERNDRQRLNLRSRLGGGFGWKLVKSRQSELSLLGGFNYINEQFRDANSGMSLPRQSSGEALGGIELATTRFNGIRLGTKLSVLPNLIDGGRYRIEYDSTVRVPLFRSMTWSVKLFDRFDSDPPLAVQRNDYGIVSAFGFSF